MKQIEQPEPPGMAGNDAVIDQMLVRGAWEMGVPLTREHARVFLAYHKEIARFSKRADLTSLADPRKIVGRHFLDSLALLAAEPPGPGARVMDVGTGSGLPGIPLKIVRQDLEVYLLEASAKKTAFLRHVIGELGLQGIEVLAGRAEDAGRSPALRESFSVATSRAVARLGTVIEYALCFVATGGSLFAYKGKGVAEELASADAAAAEVGGRVERVFEVVIPFVQGKRYLVKVSKHERCPREFPRRTGLAVRRPLGSTGAGPKP